MSILSRFFSKPYHQLMIILFTLSTVPYVYGQDRLFETQMVKVNLLPLGLRSYNVGYETTWSDQWSVSIAFGLRPKNSFPFREDIEGYYSDQDISVHQTEVSNLSITPELRRYLGTVSGLRGFYIGVFLQYARFGYNGRIDYVGGSSANSSEFMFNGGINTLTAGASVGRQWRFGQSVYLDWQIFAPSFGLNKGLVTGTRIGGNPLDHVGISVLENKPNEFNTPLINLNVDARPDEVRMNTRGAWAGLRTWLALGYRF